MIVTRRPIFWNWKSSGPIYPFTKRNPKRMESMGKNRIADKKPTPTNLAAYLESLCLPFMRDNFEALASQAAQNVWPHVDYLAALAEGETGLRRQRSIKRRIKLARFPVIKSSSSSAGAGPQRSTAQPSKTFSASSSSMIRQTLSCSAAWALVKLTLPPPLAIRPAWRADHSCSPRLSMPSIPYLRHRRQIV